jgi:hypothetical protein
VYNNDFEIFFTTIIQVVKIDFFLFFTNQSYLKVLIDLKTKLKNMFHKFQKKSKKGSKKWIKKEVGKKWVKKVEKYFNLNLDPIPDPNYSEIIQLRQKLDLAEYEEENDKYFSILSEIHYLSSIDTISYMNFDNTLYDYIDSNLWSCKEEEMMIILNHYFNVKGINSIPYLFNGGLNASDRGYGRDSDEFHPYLELAYNTMCMTKEEVIKNCYKVYRIITYIMKCTNYHLTYQPRQLFTFLLLNNCDYNYTSDILNSDDYINLTTKFITAYNKRNDICTTEVISYYNCDNTKRCFILNKMIAFRKECRLKFNKLLETNKINNDLLNLMFDFLVPKIDISQSGLCQDDPKLEKFQTKEMKMDVM